MAGNQQFREGTWIRDVATYMTQPNRPGRDIVMSARSPPVASLILACMPIAAQSNSTTSESRGAEGCLWIAAQSSSTTSKMRTGRKVGDSVTHGPHHITCPVACSHAHVPPTR
eukprot:1157665-Pelagomonas_calceolata.AAC.3